MATTVQHKSNGARPAGTASAEPLPKSLAPRWRWLISVALVLHLTAVFAAPFSGPDPASPLSQEIVRPFGPYLDATYLGHGYRFFAPAPGPSHLVKYTLEMPGGSSSAGVFPNLPEQQPRLLYHRHFMLSEKLNGLHEALGGAKNLAELPPQATPQDRENWQRAQSTVQEVARSYAQHLLHTSGAQRVTLELLRHELPSPLDMQRSRPLDDKASYQVLWTGSFRSDTP